MRNSRNIINETSVIHEDSKEYVSDFETVERNNSDKIDALEGENKKVVEDLREMKRM